jgi:hypothetical protein
MESRSEGFSEMQRIRLADILDALNEDRAASEDDIELQRLLLDSRMVHVSRAPPPWRETINERGKRMIIEESLPQLQHLLARMIEPGQFLQ